MITNKNTDPSAKPEPNLGVPKMKQWWIHMFWKKL